MVGNLTLARDWIYVLCTVIQTVLAIVGLGFVSFWWDRRKTKDERKRADQQRREEDRKKEIQREEDRQKADAEKIAAILTESYYEVEDIFHRLKESVDILREKKIVGDWTEFHVLMCMCRPDNLKKFNKTPIDIDPFVQDPQYRDSYLAKNDPRDELLSDVEEIMKFFLQFRINLFSIMQNKACPGDIKLEFSSKITEMGKTIYPFVERHRQDVIERVLKYFSSAATVQEHATPHTLEAATGQGHPNPQDQSPSTRRSTSIPGVAICCGRQEPRGDETDRLTHNTAIEMLPTASTSIESTNTNQGLELIHYPGNAAIENAIPYIKCFSYGSYQGSMKLNFYHMHPTIYTLVTGVETGEMQEREDEILEKIDELWRRNGHEPPGGGLLHSVRMIMFQQSEDRDFFNRHEGSFDEFVEYVFRKILDTDLSNNTKVIVCKRMLDDINLRKRDLSNQFKSLLVLKETYDMLENVKSILDEFMSRRIQ